MTKRKMALPKAPNNHVIAGWAWLVLLSGIMLGIGLTMAIIWRTMWPLLPLCMGLILAAVGLWHLLQTSPVGSSPALQADDSISIVSTTAPARPNTPFSENKQQDGPKIVTIGGGSGMPQLLRGLRAYTDHITAIVTVADDGGSSGRLRRQMGMLPPGDFRNNITALSDAEELMTRLFQYRFAQRSGENADSELAGHSFGNLFIATMAAVTGSFEKGLAESSRVLAVSGQVLPSTLEQVRLCAEVRRPQRAGAHSRANAPNGMLASPAHTDVNNRKPEDEIVLVEGESQIPEAGGEIVRVFLEPTDVRAFPGTIQAILRADLIVAGPGSFFTSILPNLLVPAVRDAISASVAPRIYICNVATQPGETDDYTVSDHMHQLRLHAGDAFTTVLANNNYDLATTPAPHCQWIRLPQDDSALPYRLFTGDLTMANSPRYHDPAKLAARLMDVYNNLRSSQTDV